MTKKYLFLFALMAMFTLTLSSCGDDDNKDEPQVTKELKATASATINGVNFGSYAPTLQSTILLDYGEALETKTFASKDEVIKAADEVYNAHKSAYANAITDGKVVISVDGAEVKTYDYSFAKATTVTVDAAALLTTWRLTRKSGNNGSSWLNSQRDWDSMNGYMFKADGTCERYSEEEDTYATDNCTYSLNGSVLTLTVPNSLTGGTATLTYDIVDFSSERMVLREQNSTSCTEFRPQYTVKYQLTLSDDLNSLLTKKVVKYFNRLNQVAEFDMGTASSFELTEDHVSYPVKSCMALDYTLDEGAYTEGKSINLSYSWKIELTRGADQKALTPETNTVSKTVTSLADIKSFIEAMCKDLSSNGVLISWTGEDINLSFNDQTTYE